MAAQGCVQVGQSAVGAALFVVCGGLLLVYS